MEINTASVLIRTKNEAKDLPKALDLIRSQSLKPVDIIVVDSGSTDGTVEIVKQQKDIKLIQIPAVEFTFGGSLNIGLEATTGEVVISLSAHAFPCDQQWLRNLVRHFYDPQVAGVYGKQVPQPDAWPPVERDYLEFYGQELRIQTNSDDSRDHIFSNANSAIRRQCWEKYHFDETLSGCEDQDWAWAMLKLGYKIIYEPEAVVYHSHNEPLRKVYQRGYREALAQKLLYQTEMGLRSALRNWYRSVLADIRFILDNKNHYDWLLRVPVYRLFSIYGYLSPSLPAALWKPFHHIWRKQAKQIIEVKEIGTK